jgi:hypothetical protein
MSTETRIFIGIELALEATFAAVAILTGWSICFGAAVGCGIVVVLACLSQGRP